MRVIIVNKQLYHAQMSQAVLGSEHLSEESEKKIDPEPVVQTFNPGDHKIDEEP